MKKSAVRTILAEMARGRKSLRSAKTLLREGLCEDAVSRAYYAVFHAARAALAANDISPETHRGVRQMFALHLVKPGMIEREYAEILTAQQEDRETCEYSVAVEITVEDAAQRVDEAGRFFTRIESYIESLGIRRAAMTDAGDGKDSRTGAAAPPSGDQS